MPITWVPHSVADCARQGGAQLWLEERAKGGRRERMCGRIGEEHYGFEAGAKASGLVEPQVRHVVIEDDAVDVLGPHIDFGQAGAPSDMVAIDLQSELHGAAEIGVGRDDEDVRHARNPMRKQ